MKHKAFVTACALAILGLITVPVIVHAEGAPSWHSIDADLVESRALASLDFRDPGSAASLLEAKQQAKRIALTQSAIAHDPLRSYAETSGSIEADMGISTLTPEHVDRSIKSHQDFEKQVMSQLEADSRLDSRLESLLHVDADEELDEWADDIGEHIEDMKDMEDSTEGESTKFSLLEADAQVDRRRRRSRHRRRHRAPRRRRHSRRRRSRRRHRRRSVKKIFKRAVRSVKNKVKSKISSALKKGKRILKTKAKKVVNKLKAKLLDALKSKNKSKSKKSKRKSKQSTPKPARGPKGYAPGSPAFEKHTRELYKVNRIPGQPSDTPIDLPLPKFPVLKRPAATTQAAINRAELNALRTDLANQKKSLFPDVGVVRGNAPTSVYIKQLEADAAKAEGTIGARYINKVVDDLKVLSGVTYGMKKISDREVIDMVKDRSLGSMSTTVNLLETQSAPTAKDVVDCVACRFAWLGVEKDIGNSIDPVYLYDAFVGHCSNMQQTNIFFNPCTQMFRQVDAMIGNYMAGMSVNQLCAAARMCR